jgi:uncharacterized membrane protein
MAIVDIGHIERYMKARRVWGHFYRASSYARSTLWMVPFVAILLVLLITPALRALDDATRWHIAGLNVAGATALYQTVITLALSFMVFTFGSLLVAIQVAGGQMTPRIIATTLLRDNVVRFSVGLFVFSLVFAVMSLNRLGDRVHELLAFVGALLGVACMATFLFLIDYAARLLRPISVLARVGNHGVTVIEAVYPLAVGDADEAPPRAAVAPSAPARVVRYGGTAGIILAVDVDTLVREARRCDGLVELIPQVGDFVAHEEPLFALYGGAAAIDDGELHAAIAFGPERTLEQDPLFAFRILVDIGLKALSPAINDPTTAVLALDQVHRLLREVGRRTLQHEVVRDDDAAPRVIRRTPNWADFVHVSCQEIRTCGAANIQIARRMRALIENLCASLPPFRLPALQAELRDLDHVVDTLYTLESDRALARQGDAQGLGATSSTRAPG